MGFRGGPEGPPHYPLCLGSSDSEDCLPAEDANAQQDGGGAAQDAGNNLLIRDNFQGFSFDVLVHDFCFLSITLYLLISTA